MNGYQGKLDEALRVAKIGMDIADQAGDEWIASLIRLALGASYLLEGDCQCAGLAGSGGKRIPRMQRQLWFDSVARMWQCIAWYKQEAYELLVPTLGELFTICQKNHYDFLLYPANYDRAA